MKLKFLDYQLLFAMLLFISLSYLAASYYEEIWSAVVCGFGGGMCLGAFVIHRVSACLADLTAEAMAKKEMELYQYFTERSETCRCQKG